mgnify:FL=1|jgi:hypothetical protein
MIVHKHEITQKDRNASSIQDFYYRGTEFEETGGTGIRGLAKKYLKERKIIDRRLVLKDNGCALEITTIFKNKDCFLEFMQEDRHNDAKTFFKDKEWCTKTEVYEITEELSIKTVALKNIIMSFKELTLEEIKNKITELFR